MKVFILKEFGYNTNIVLTVNDAIEIIKKDLYTFYSTEYNWDNDKIKQYVLDIITNYLVYNNEEFLLETCYHKYELISKELDEIFEEYCIMSKQLIECKDREMWNHWKDLKAPFYS